jgi:Holliday junction resolvase RusA-like endonuclease
VTAPWADGQWRPGPHDQPTLTITVWGRPGTAGSKTSFPIYAGSGPNRHFTGRVATVQDDKTGRNKDWRTAVREAALRRVLADDGIHLRPGYPIDEAVLIDLVFTVPKPTSAPKNRRTWPVARPDTLKYARAVEDELKYAGVLKDDARITDYGRLSKVFPGEDVDALDAPGCVIRIWRKADIHGARVTPDPRLAAVRKDLLETAQRLDPKPVTPELPPTSPPLWGFWDPE